MNFKNSWRILKKDWQSSIRSKEILLPMALLPVVFTILTPILMLIGIIMAPGEVASEFGDIEEIARLLEIPDTYNEVLVAATFMIKLFILPIFLFIPALIPSIIASDSFAGEKERKTMESLVLLPISKSELILGKVLTALLPSLAITFSCFGLLGLVVNLMLLPYLEGHLLIFTDASFMLAIFVLAPLYSFLSNLLGIIISSRVKDLKSAQSISGSVVLPVLGLLFVQIFNPAFLSPLMIGILSLVMGGLCVIFINVANKVLDVEKLVLMT